MPNKDENLQTLEKVRIQLIALIVDEQGNTEPVWWPEKGTLDDLRIRSTLYYQLIQMAETWVKVTFYDDSP